MEAKENKNKEKESIEPFPPENTPVPPQVMDPSKPPQNIDVGKSSADFAKSSQQNQKEKKQDKPKDRPKLLGESEPEIDDETTI